VLLHEIDPSQAWVWTPEWQEKLQRSLDDLEAGRTKKYASGEDFLASL
jgi:hypothetical protein